MEKTLDVIAKVWINTESGRQPTILELYPFVKCKNCVHHKNGICMMWSHWSDHKIQTTDEGYCYHAKEKR